MKLKETTITNEQSKNTKPQAAKFGEAVTAKTDLPEYIKAEDLTSIFPFTIFGAKESTGRYGQRIRFDVAYRVDGNVEKKVLTLSKNDERQEIMFQVRKHRALTNCRLIELHIGDGQTYWKIVDADAPLPEDNPVDAADTTFDFGL